MVQTPCVGEAIKLRRAGSILLLVSLLFFAFKNHNDSLLSMPGLRFAGHGGLFAKNARGFVGRTRGGGGFGGTLKELFKQRVLLCQTLCERFSPAKTAASRCSSTLSAPFRQASSKSSNRNGTSLRCNLRAKKEVLSSSMKHSQKMPKVDDG